MSTRWVDSTHDKAQATLAGATELRVVDDPTGVRSSKKTTLTELVAFIKSTIGLAGSDIANTPAGNIAATNVQNALNELDTEKVAKAGDTMTGALTIDFGSGAVPGSLPINGNVKLVLRSDDGVSGRLLLDGFDAHVVYSGRRANTSRAAPSALQAGDSMTEINGFGYGATDYQTTNGVKIDLRAAENWSDAAQGTQIDFHTTPNGSTSASRANIARLTNNGRLAVGPEATLSADARLTISDNDGVTSATSSGTVAHFVGANTAAARIFLDSFGSSVQYATRRANGTRSEPSALVTNDSLGQFAAFGYGATAYAAASRGNFLFVASENWTDVAQGTHWLLQLTPTGSTTSSEWFKVSADTGVSFQGSVVIDKNRLHQMRVYTVATLPAAGTAGRRGAVSDSDATLTAGIGAVVAGGGANNVPVYDDGANWRIG